ncbi:tRNA pseudouridine(54/55) synthase Pus10 [Methanothermococcus sp. SCGC AD-155-M21]|nr:tRNA pseudouridine(54/55) synthase Pus10 [Methanothermococcus sp. SCGC AD-155-M21]
MDIIGILKDYPLCHRCFGRLCGKVLHTSNYERGKSIKMAKAMELESKLYSLMEKYDDGNNEDIDKDNDDYKDNNNDKDNDTNHNLDACNNNKGNDMDKILQKIKEDLYYIHRSGLLEIKGINGEEEYSTNENMEINCPWCKSIFNEKNLNDILEGALSLLKDYQYDSFLVGTILPKDIKKLEEEIRTPYMESIRQEFNRVMGRLLVENTGKIVDKQNPDIVIKINPYNKKIELQVNSIFIKGRYRKLIRGIPQTKWPCNHCRGKGCENCNYTGKRYNTSVEEIIAEPFMEVFKGKDESFHGAGREDIDVRMLGKGRPFVLQIKEPKIRKANLEEIKEKINRSGSVEVLNLEYGIKRDVVFFKNEPHRKTYLAVVECEEEVSNEELLKVVKNLENSSIDQRTPLRVSHRRADLIRVRRVYDVEVNRIDPKTFELKIYCDGGLYIKELISGDENRTLPSVSEILNKKCKCKTLDVLEVHDEDV